MRLIDADKITDQEIIYYLGGGFADCAPDIRYLIDDQTTIDPYSIVGLCGRWEPYKHENMRGFHYCSVCIAGAPFFREESGRKEMLFRFCPNCGAKMIDGEAGEDERRTQT